MTLMFCSMRTAVLLFQDFFFIFSVYLMLMQGLTEVHNTLRLLLMVLVGFMIRNKLLKERLIAISINYFA